MHMQSCTPAPPLHQAHKVLTVFERRGELERQRGQRFVVLDVVLVWEGVDLVQLPSSALPHGTRKAWQEEAHLCLVLDVDVTPLKG